MPQLIPHVLPGSGFVLVVSRPKMGKSIFCQNLSLAASTGSEFFGFVIPKRRVLFLALEGGLVLFKERMSKMLAWTPSDDLIVTDNLEKTLCPTGREWLEKRIADCKFGLVIIDPLTAMLPSRVDVSDYGHVLPIINDLNNIATKAGCLIVGTWHTIKANGRHGNLTGLDSILGSTALAGGLDTALILHREGPKAKEAKLEVIARQFEADDFGLAFDGEHLTWSVNDNLGLTAIQRAVYQVFKDKRAHSSKDVAKRQHATEQAARLQLRDLENLGLISRQKVAGKGRSWQYFWQVL